MKLMEAINAGDALTHNTYTQTEKIGWISRLDRLVQQTVIDTHAGGTAEFDGYNDDTDPAVRLLIPEPYDEAYLLWIESKIHYYNGEYDKYNNAVERFNQVFASFKNYYNRTHMPKGRKFRF